MKKNFKLSLVISAILTIVYLVIYLCGKSIPQELFLFNNLPILAPEFILPVYFCLFLLFTWIVIWLLKSLYATDKELIDESYITFYIILLILLITIIILSNEFFNLPTAAIIVAITHVLIVIVVFAGPYSWDFKPMCIELQPQPEAGLIVGLISSAVIGIVTSIIYIPLAGADVWAVFSITTTVIYAGIWLLIEKIDRPLNE